MAELAAWAAALPRPRAVLMVSAHWKQAPLTLGATEAGVPLIYDFYGFPDRYYAARYPAPPAPELAQRVAELAGGEQAVAHEPSRGLDHGAYVPLVAMYPEADVPVLQLSLPTLDPGRLLELGARLRPLRDEGVLIVGSGFMTHGLPYLREFVLDAPPPDWSKDFDQWVAAALEARDVAALERVPRGPLGAVRPPHRRALRPAVRRAGRRRARRSGGDAHLGLLAGPLQTLRAVRLTATEPQRRPVLSSAP